MPRKSKKPVIGVYSSLYYQIKQGRNVVYQAGNHPQEPQGYVSEEEGVGLEEMRSMCESSLSRLSEALGVENGGASEKKVYAIFWDDDNHPKTLGIDPPRGKLDFTWRQTGEL